MYRLIDGTRNALIDGRLLLVFTPGTCMSTVASAVSVLSVISAFSIVVEQGVVSDSSFGGSRKA